MTIDIHADAARLAASTTTWADPTLAHLAVPFVPPYLRAGYAAYLAGELDALLRREREACAVIADESAAGWRGLAARDPDAGDRDAEEAENCVETAMAIGAAIRKRGAA